MPAGSSVYTARFYAALFGEIADLETWPGRMQIGYTIFLCTYTHTESALICHGMSFEVSDGEIAWDSTAHHDAQQFIKTEIQPTKFTENDAQYLAEVHDTTAIAATTRSENDVDPEDHTPAVTIESENEEDPGAHNDTPLE